MLNGTIGSISTRNRRHKSEGSLPREYPLDIIPHASHCASYFIGETRMIGRRGQNESEKTVKSKSYCGNKKKKKKKTEIIHWVTTWRLFVKVCVRVDSHVSLRILRCSKASRPREFSDISTSCPSIMSRRKGRTLTMTLWDSAPRDSTTPFSSWDRTDRLRQRGNRRSSRRISYKILKGHIHWKRNAPLFLFHRVVAAYMQKLSRDTHGSVGGSLMSTSGTS